MDAILEFKSQIERMKCDEYARPKMDCIFCTSITLTFLRVHIQISCSFIYFANHQSSSECILYWFCILFNIQHKPMLYNGFVWHKFCICLCCKSISTCFKMRPDLLWIKYMFTYSLASVPVRSHVCFNIFQIPEGIYHSLCIC